MLRNRECPPGGQGRSDQPDLFLRRSNIELHNYKKYNERILQNLPIGIVILDPSLRIHFLNQTALSIVSPDDPHALPKAGADLPPPIASMLSTPELIDELLKVRLGDRLIQAATFPFGDTDGEALGMILLLEDVTGETRMKDYLMRAERLKSTAALASSLAQGSENHLKAANLAGAAVQFLAHFCGAVQADPRTGVTIRETLFWEIGFIQLQLTWL